MRGLHPRLLEADEATDEQQAEVYAAKAKALLESERADVRSRYPDNRQGRRAAERAIRKMGLADS